MDPQELTRNQQHVDVAGSCRQMVAGFSHTHVVNDCSSWMLPMNSRERTRNQQLVVGAGSCSRQMVAEITHNSL
jgi:hypothetical protein